MPKFRKKPVVIEAWPVRDLHHDAEMAWKQLPTPIVAAYEKGDVLFLNHPRRMEVRTLEGWMAGNIDDMMIRGVAGELYFCKPDIFAATYEPEEATAAELGAEVRRLGLVGS